MPQLAGCQSTVTFIQGRITDGFVVFIEIARAGVITTIARAILIANAPGTQRMQLARRDHQPLQVHRAGQRKFNNLVGLAAFSVNVENLQLLLRRIGCRVTANIISGIKILRQSIVDRDLRL